MKKIFLRTMMMALLLTISTNAAWADDIKFYVASMQAQTSPASTGDGQVKLTWLDIKGNPMTSTMAQIVAPNNPVGWAETAQLVGGTICAMEGIEVSALEIVPENVTPPTQLYMTSFLYFSAEAKPANGSYLAGWTFTDPNITRLDTIGDAKGGVYFKLLPDTTNYGLFPSGDRLATALGTVMTNPSNIYAVFKKYLLSNPQAESGQLEATYDAETPNSVTFKVSVDIEGDMAALKPSFVDFTFPSFPGTPFDNTDSNGTWSWTVDPEYPYGEYLNPNKGTAHLLVTFTTKEGITVGRHNTTLTLAVAGNNPSTLHIPLTVNALDPDRPEAKLYNGKNLQVSGNLSTLLGQVGNYATPVLQLNKNCEDLTLSDKTFTLDLNGNTAGNITVNSGDVTIAYSDFGGNADTLTVNGGKVTLNGGTFTSLTVADGAVVEQNGATISGAATNNGTLTTTNGTFNGGLTSTNALTLNGGTFKGETAVTVSGGTANINRGDINGIVFGLKVTNGTANVKKLAVIKGGTSSVNGVGGTLNIDCGKFIKPLTGTFTFTSGYFKNIEDTVGVSKNKTLMLVSTGVEYNEGYRYFLGDTESAKTNGVGVCRIGETSYAKLEDAIAYANNNPSLENIVIFMTNDYTLPAGYYTLPANATIVVPMSDTQRKEVNRTVPRISFNDMDLSHPYQQPTEFRRLTFANGVNIDVFGKIELTCTQFASNEAYTAQPYGPYGHLVMEEGSHMTLQGGSELRAWGFMTGKGETDARRNATVREMFQMGDWKGAMTSVQITGMAPGVVENHSQYKIFPVTQYFIQNVESPVKYHPGAVLSTAATVSEGLLNIIEVTMAANDIKIVGVNGRDAAIFLMDNGADADNTWVRKWYDAKNDIQVYDINSAAHIGSMVLDMGELNIPIGNYGTIPVRLNSANFDLPITTNMKIHLLSGSMDFKQNTCLLPGSEIEVDKESEVSVAKDNNDTEHTGALYVYDADEWDKYAYVNVVEEGKSTAYTKVVRYTPSWNGTPNKRNEQTKPADAAINVHGTFNTARGYVYTSEHGANIFSTNEDAGTFIFNQDASNAGERTVYQVKGENTYESRTFTSAQLKNGDETHESTASAQTGDAYCYQDYMWTIMKVDEDNPCFMVDNHDRFYAKPADYIEVVASKDGDGNIIGNANTHTYSDAAGAGRLFILMEDDCQWWEVEQKDNYFHCIHPQNDTYYYWGEDPEDGIEKWLEKKFTITWQNWDGTLIPTNNGAAEGYEVPYGTMAEFLGTNPTREANVDSTYNFTGWKPALGPVTQDVTYTATYESQPRMYTIIFQNQGGTEIERQFLTHNTVPVCENTPAKVGKILVWSPAISPVITDATYTATWIDEPPTEWDVTFVNNAGGILKATHKVGISENPSYTGTPAKENADHTAYSSNEYTYTFWGWSAIIDGVAQTFEAGTDLPYPTGNTTYTAVYTQSYQTYDITFLDEDGDEIETNSYRYGETPVCSATPTEPNNAEEGYTYSFAWTPQIQTVQGTATYRASFTGVKNKYTVTLLSSIEGACALTGAGIYEYGNDATLNATANSGYTFLHWDDGNTDNQRTVNVKDNLTYTAIMQSTTTVEDKTIDKNETYDVPENTKVKDLVICSDGTTSGSIINAQNLKVDGNAYFNLTLNANAGTWYAVAVPWQVSVANGIYVDDAKKTLNRDYYFVQYNGAIRAAQGTVDDCWQFVNSGNLQPGTFYMIYLRNAATTIRFAKAAYTPIINRQITVQMYPQATGDEKDANWNGIANPAVFHANMEGLGVTSTDENKKAQVFDKSKESLTTVLLSEHTFQVGEPVFIQAETAKSMVLSPETPAPAPARRMAPALESNSEYDIRIAQEDKPYTDRLFISTAEEKADKYVIGQDLAKMGSSAIAAQMWVNRYNAKLCVNRTEMQDNQAVFPLCIFAPKAGEYQISSATPAIEGEEIYVTINGNPVWNLAAGAYTAILPVGNSTQYGLLVTRQNAPAMPTDVEETITGNDAVRKVLVNNQVYILRDGAVYTVTGQKLK